MAYTRTQATWADGSGGGTAIDAADLENYDRGLLATNNDLVVLIWNGTTYLPKSGVAVALSDTSKAREFRGATDPSTLPGAVMSDYDTWLPVT